MSASRQMIRVEARYMPAIYASTNMVIARFRLELATQVLFFQGKYQSASYLDSKPMLCLKFYVVIAEISIRLSWPGQQTSSGGVCMR